MTKVYLKSFNQYFSSKINLLFFIVASLFFVWSGVNPKNYAIWFLEIFPAFIAIIFFIFFSDKFRVSNLLFRIISIHIIILAVGAHFTYAEVPFFDYLKEMFNMKRNNYDKIGHFFQGITPALLAKEIILRRSSLKEDFFINFFAISCALSFSALYELLEWGVAVSSGVGQDFVSLQGDVWDAQKDMLVALIGAIFIIYVSKKYYFNSKNGL